MKDKIALFSSLILLSILLFGCTDTIPPSALPPAALISERNACISHCQTQESHCQNQHEKSYQQCKNNAENKAKKRYDTYVTAQNKANKKVEKNCNDFLDLSSCHQQLDCNSGLDTCYSSCNTVS